MKTKEAMGFLEKDFKKVEGIIRDFVLPVVPNQGNTLRRG